MSKTPMDIRLRYSTIDHFSETRRFKTLEGARRYARKRMGENYDLGSTYAVDMFGTGKLEASGVSLEELLRRDEEPKPKPDMSFEGDYY